jgi:hypothetical protein
VPRGRPSSLLSGDDTVDLDARETEAAVLVARARQLRRGWWALGIGGAMVLLTPALPLGVAPAADLAIRGVVQARQGDGGLELAEENYAALRRGDEVVARAEVFATTNAPGAGLLGLRLSVQDSVRVRTTPGGGSSVGGGVAGEPGASASGAAGRALAADRAAMTEALARGVDARWPEAGVGALIERAGAWPEGQPGQQAEALATRVVIGPSLRLVWFLAGLCLAGVGGLALRRSLG